MSNRLKKALVTDSHIFIVGVFCSLAGLIVSAFLILNTLFHVYNTNSWTATETVWVVGTIISYAGFQMAVALIVILLIMWRTSKRIR